MKKALILFFFSLLLTACSPSEGMIQTAIAETSMAQPTTTNAPVPTATIIPTPTPTPVPSLDGDWVKFNDNQSSPGFIAQWASHFDQNSVSSYYAYQGERNITEIMRMDENQYSSSSSGAVFDYEFSADGSIMLRRYIYGGANYFDYYGRMASDQPMFVYDISERPALNKNIHLVYPGPDFRTEILTTENRDENPTFSPDNLKISFLRHEDTNGDGVYDGYDSITNLFQMNLDGSNIEKLTNDIGSIWDYSWSPQGNQIVFVSNWTCYILDLTSKNVAPFYNGDVCNFPQWSPDGEWIAFWHKAEDGLLYPTVARPDGSDGHAVSDTGADRIYSINWMADGRLVYNTQQDSYVLVKIGDEINTRLNYYKEVPVLAAYSQNLFNWASYYQTQFPENENKISIHNVDQLTSNSAPISLDFSKFDKEKLSAYTFSLSNQLIAMGTDEGQISVWKLSDGKEVLNIAGDSLDICRLSFLAGKNQLLRSDCLSEINLIKALESGKKLGENISLVELSDGKIIQTYRPLIENLSDTSLFYAVGVSEKGVFLIEKSNQSTGTVYYLDLQNGTTRIAFSIPYAYRGSYFSVSSDGMLVNVSNKVFDRITGGLVATIPVDQSNFNIGFSPDNKLVFIVNWDNGVINAVDIFTGEIRFTFQAEQPLIYGAVIDNGKSYAALGKDYRVYIWTLK